MRVSNINWPRRIALRCSLVLLFLLTQVVSSTSQTYRSQQTQILTFNVLLNGVIGGIGGALNKEKGDKLLPVFAKNFLAGCIGGSIKYVAKYDSYNINYDPELGNNQKFSGNAWLDKFIYSAGYSIVHNASLNQKPWESFQVNILGINLYY